MYRVRTLHSSDLVIGPDKNGRPSLDTLNPAKIRGRHVLGPGDALDKTLRHDFLKALEDLFVSGYSDKDIAALLGVPDSVIWEYRESRDV